MESLFYYFIIRAPIYALDDLLCIFNFLCVLVTSPFRWKFFFSCAEIWYSLRHVENQLKTIVQVHKRRSDSDEFVSYFSIRPNMKT